MSREVELLTIENQQSLLRMQITSSATFLSEVKGRPQGQRLASLKTSCLTAGIWRQGEELSKSTKSYQIMRSRRSYSMTFRMMRELYSYQEELPPMLREITKQRTSFTVSQNTLALIMSLASIPSLVYITWPISLAPCRLTTGAKS